MKKSTKLQVVEWSVLIITVILTLQFLSSDRPVLAGAILILGLVILGRLFFYTDSVMVREIEQKIFSGKKPTAHKLDSDDPEIMELIKKTQKAQEDILKLKDIDPEDLKKPMDI